MRTFTDEEMGQLLPERQALQRRHPQAGPKYEDDSAAAIIWEQVAATSGSATTASWRWYCPSRRPEVCGIGVFAAAIDETIAIMNGDPGVAAERVHLPGAPCRGFPGDSLP